MAAIYYDICRISDKRMVWLLYRANLGPVLVDMHATDESFAKKDEDLMWFMQPWVGCQQHIPELYGTRCFEATENMTYMYWKEVFWGITKIRISEYTPIPGFNER